MLEASDVDASSKALEPKKQKTGGGPLSFKNLRTQFAGGNLGAQSYSHIPTLDRQETSKKESVTESDHGEEGMMELP